jgi:hypothetical protein
VVDAVHVRHSSSGSFLARIVVGWNHVRHSSSGSFLARIVVGAVRGFT